MEMPLGAALPLAKSAAGRWIRRFPRGSIVEYDDLVQEAVLVYFACLPRFRNGGGAAFSTYFMAAVLHRFAAILKSEERVFRSCVPLEQECGGESRNVLDEVPSPAPLFLDALAFLRPLSKRAERYLTTALSGAHPCPRGREKLKRVIGRHLGFSVYVVEAIRQEILAKALV